MRNASTCWTWRGATRAHVERELPGLARRLTPGRRISVQLFFEDPERRRSFLEAVRESVRQGPEAFAWEEIDVCLPWGFRLADIATDMTAGVKEKYDKLIGEGLTLERRWGQPEDVGRAVAALARGDFPYATGQVVNIDGGMMIGRL